MKNYTTSNSGSSKLDMKDIKRLVKLLESANNVFNTKIEHNSEKFKDELQKLKFARDVGVKNIYGVPIYERKYLPKNIVRMHQSDGRFVDIKVK